MKHFTHSLIVLALTLTVAITFSSPVTAHVVVRPAEVLTSSFETFTIGVPNEKNNATTNIRLVIPKGLQYVTPTQKAGWTIDIEKEGEGNAATVTAITWSGSTIEPGLRDEFTFSAKVPEKPVELQWKAYQTYADGTVVSWDQASDGGHSDSAKNNGPFSVTKVVTETAQQAKTKDNTHASANTNATADRSLIIAVVSAVVSLASIFIVTRKK